MGIIQGIKYFAGILYKIGYKAGHDTLGATLRGIHY
jgi:hypothetical protein